MVKFISRRQLIAGSLGTVVAACAANEIADDEVASPTPTTASASPTTSPTEAPAPTATPNPTATPEPAIELAGDPFALDVASGEPLTDSVILWTRLVPDPIAEDGGMPDEAIPVTWEFMDDDASQTLHSVEVMALPEDAHAVHIEVTGLEPDTWYRFHAAGYTSPAGRTRTLPEGDVDQFTFAMASCQTIQFGEYAAWRDIAEQPDLDAVLFGGDYIYENPAFDLSPQRDEHRKWRTPPPSDLATFRLRYAQTKSDVHLQAAHAAVPWWIMWDDHEITDNYWREGGGITDFAGGPLEPRRVAAYQA